jgi:hypothetical protein
MRIISSNLPASLLATSSSLLTPKVVETNSITPKELESSDVAIAAVVGKFYQLPKSVVAYIKKQNFPCVKSLEAVHNALDAVTDVSAAVELVTTYAAELSTGNEPAGHHALREHLAENEALRMQALRAGSGQALLDPQPVFAEWARAIAERIVTNLSPLDPEFAALRLEHRCLALAYPLYELNWKVMAQAFPELKRGTYQDDVLRYCLGRCVEPILSTVAERLGWIPESARDLERIVDFMNDLKTRPKLLDDKVREGDAPIKFQDQVADLAALRSFCSRALGQLPREETLTRIKSALSAVPSLPEVHAPFREEYLPAARIAVVLDPQSETGRISLVQFDGHTRNAAVVCASENNDGKVALDYLSLCRDGSLGNSPLGVTFPEASSELYRETRRLAHQAYAAAYASLAKVWETCPEAITLFQGEQFIYVAAADEDHIAVWAPERVVSNLREMMQIAEADSEELLDLARTLSSSNGDSYTVITIATGKSEVEAELSPQAPQVARDEKALRAEIRDILERQGSLEFDDLVGKLRKFGVWHQAGGNGSHGALLCEREGRMKYTTCTSIREAEALPPRIIFNVVKGLGISLEEFRDCLVDSR